MNKQLQLFIALLFFSFGVKSQDIHFSQFDETPLQLNPANAGVKHELRFIGNYKSQWQSVNAPFKTIAFSADGRLMRNKKHHLGLGLDFFSDNSGDGQIKTNQANLSLSGIIKVNENNRITAGLMTGFAQRGINTGSYTFGNQYNGTSYDATRPTGELATNNNFSYIDAAAGLLWSYGKRDADIASNDAKKVNIGFAIFHPHKPAYSFFDNQTRLYAKFVFHGDASIGLKNTNVTLKPSYIVFIQGPAKEITPGMMFQYTFQDVTKYTNNKKFTAVSFGGYYRTQDAFIAAAKIEYNGYAIGFSYDINLSQLRTVSSARGGFELSLRAAFNSFVRGGKASIY